MSICLPERSFSHVAMLSPHPADGRAAAAAAPGGAGAGQGAAGHARHHHRDASGAGPVSAPIGAGAHTLHQTWVVSATHPKSLLGKAASAEFAPDPALDPLWISYKEPFHGAVKKDFGFQVIVKVADDTPPEPKKEN